MKYIKNRNTFLYEQDFGEIDQFGQEQTPQEQPQAKELFFLFLDPDIEKNKRKYPDGSSEVDYPVYSTTDVELDEWLDKNIVSTEKNGLNSSTEKLVKNNIKEIILGKKVNISNRDIEFIKKLKNAVASDMFGKREPEETIIFTADGIPTTDNILITFIPIDFK